MTKTEVLRELKANGSEQTRKTYRRHGMTGDMYGVSYAVLGKMKRKIKVDQALAEQLWETGNVDARVLATMIADPSAMKASTITSWAKTLDSAGMAAALSNVVAETPFAVKQIDKWTSGRDELRACAGWHALASLARDDDALPDSYFLDHLETIESTIHASKNWARYAMNNALISIGARNSKLEKRSLAAARKIGKVDVDHGDTACKTPDATTYIKKAAAKARQKKANAAGGRA